MQAPKYIETNPILLREQKLRQDIHLHRLQEIKRRPRDLSQPLDKHSSPSRLHRSPDRQFDIHLENKVLFEKLLSIQTSRASVTPLRSDPRSLNVTIRQREMERIAEENSQLARRLVEQEAHLSRKKLDLEYSQVCKYKEQISKAILHSKRKTKAVPLQAAA
jgi:hypothetical protein